MYFIYNTCEKTNKDIVEKKKKTSIIATSNVLNEL